ncbi:MAG: class I SAM-dependent methyltransferase [Planctomycetaceae bacterium]|nr:class I SAM-dependent methyltransferase [Planctomycetaceae bacterium]
MPEHDWSMHYQSGVPPWETGQPSSELRRVIAEEKIQPCRIIELGCGSGINAVWLAQQGFDVTALDVTPLAIEKAQKRAQAAGVAVKFVLADVLDLRESFEPFPFFFDRGCYHAVRDLNVQGYLRTLAQVTAPGSLGLILTGNAREPSPPGQGPPVVSDEQLHSELEPLLKIVRLREFRFDTNEEMGASPLAWSCLLRRAG